MLTPKNRRIRLAAVLLAGITGIGALAGCSGRGGAQGWKASEEEMKKAEEAYAETRFSVGCWIPPRIHQMPDDESALARLQELKDSGINFIATHHGDLGDMDFIFRVLNAAEKTGIDVIIELNTDLSKSGINWNLNVVKRTVDYPALAGYNLYDEPGDAGFAALTREFEAVKELVRDKGKVVYMNLLPNYGPMENMAPVVTEGLTPYRTYLDNALKTGTEILSFDFYPYSSGGNDESSICRMLENLSDMAVMAKKYGVSCAGFLQNSSWPGMREPEATELRFLSSIHLAFGFKSYSYFLYAEPYKDSGFNGMLTWEGETTPQYKRVRANNAEISGYKGRFLNYDLDGFYTDRLEGSYGDFIAPELKRSIKNDAFLKSFDAEFSVLTGVFGPRLSLAPDGADDSAPAAYFILNFDSWNRNTVTLNFRTSTPYTVWTSDGIVAMGSGSSVSFPVAESGFAFVELTAGEK